VIVSAAILAGGRATRFGGRDKSALQVGGRSILDRQLEELSCLTDDVLIVGRLLRPDTGVRHVIDRVEGCGPLGGLDAALAAARSDIVAVVACDMPFITSRFLQHLLACRETADAVVPYTSRGYHPLCAIYTRACQPAIARRLDARQLALRDLLPELRLRVVGDDELAGFDYERMLANVNTPDELDALPHGREPLHSHHP
jgi:molybdopterin-guanine dinucleotide biosynthesis protein A